MASSDDLRIRCERRTDTFSFRRICSLCRLVERCQIPCVVQSSIMRRSPVVYFVVKRENSKF